MRISLIFLLSTFLLQPVWADFLDGISAYSRKDYQTAFKEFLPLAKQGDSDAQFYLGGMYKKGLGVTQDYKEAVKWYRKAAEQGDYIALFYLGMMYRNGEGVIQDYKEAVKWYRKAAEQGAASAQYNLGWMYDNGHGVIQDYVYAHMWVNIAASLGNENSLKARDLIAKEMTPDQIEKAQRLARECVAKKYKEYLFSVMALWRQSEDHGGMMEAVNKTV